MKQNIETTTAPVACPECGGAEIAVEVKSWADFTAGKPAQFDDEDICFAEPIKGGQCICKTCQLIWEPE